jgi:hypothetical protein
MTNVKLEKSTALKLYPEAPDWFKKVLVETFGEDCFRKKDWNDFKTFEDLCQAIGTTEADFNRKWEHADLDPSTLVFERLKVCTRAYNQDWPFNAYDTNQRKWYPYFEVSSSGFGFSCTIYNFDGADAGVGSRLCFESQEKAEHAGRNFIKLFEEFITAKY